MKLDLRLPLGLMFTIFGAILTWYGLASDQAIYDRSLGINVNLWWGLVVLAFGLVMLGVAIRAGGTRLGRRETASSADGGPSS